MQTAEVHETNPEEPDHSLRNIARLKCDLHIYTSHVYTYPAVTYTSHVYTYPVVTYTSTSVTYTSHVYTYPVCDLHVYQCDLHIYTSQCDLHISRLHVCYLLLGVEQNDGAFGLTHHQRSMFSGSSERQTSLFFSFVGIFRLKKSGDRRPVSVDDPSLTLQTRENTQLPVSCGLASTLHVNDYRPVALISVMMKCFEKLVRDFITSSLPASTDPLQFAYRHNRSTDDAIAHLLHTTLTHLDKGRGNYVKMLFVDYSSAFNTIIPSLLTTKLEDLGLHTSLCDWISNFLTDRPQSVRVGNCASSTLTLSTGAPQGCVLSPLLYSLYTYDCTATSSSTIIVKFADDTVVMVLISDNDERAYLEEIKHLENWCQENNLLLNVSKTKELIVDCSKKQERHYQPVRISGTTVERVDSFRYLGVHISQNLSSSRHTNSLAKKARQRLYHLRRLRDFRLPSKVLRNFYTCTIESILTGNITVWFGNSTKQDRQALQTVERITHTELPDLQTIYHKRCQTKARRIVKDPTHPNNRLFSLLSSPHVMMKGTREAEPSDRLNSSEVGNGTAEGRKEYYFNNWMTLLSQLPLLLFTLLNSILYPRISEKVRIAGSLVFILLLFVLTAALVMVPMEQDLFFSVTMATIWFINSFGAVLQGSLFGLVALLPLRYSSVFMSGQGLAGTFAAVALLFAIAISGQQAQRPALIVVGDFNSAKLKHAVPNLYQHVTFPTRRNGTLDHCYTPYKDSYKALAHPPFGKSDHAAIFLITKYKQRLKQEASVQTEVTCWTDQSVAAL
ncbi:hypothetical protein P4O66_001919 [Electrophorus voltai]|uniref:Reverse transcriptase domain-containing protein n=1 Tax=Electrophorus voltai TaxID=2609070 RepID=A0AAD8Z452_9TELE|nr:hypothetical protein P4O66_001919 [Electrophorus voltai]